MFATKWADFVSQLAITQMTFFFHAVGGNPITKSIEMESYFHMWISKGSSSPISH